MANNSSVNQNLLNEFSQYFDPSAFQIPSGAGMQGGSGQGALGGFGGIAANGLAPGAGALINSFTGGGFDPMNILTGGLSGLFGGSSPSWKPYIDANGNYVWTNPKSANPVPVTSVPGAHLKPSKTYQQSANNLSALQALFPALSQVISGQIIPQEQAQLAAAQATSGPYAQLMTDLYQQYAPNLANLGNQINQISMMGTAQNQANVLNGPGQALTQAANSLLQQTNPEYYAQRANTNQQINNLYNSINGMLNGGLSPTMTQAIGQGLAQQNAQAGTSNAPGQFNTTANALRYGQAGQQQTYQEQSNLSQAIQAANNFLPQSQVSFNPIAQATGMNMNNPGTANFTGINSSGQNTFGQLANMAQGASSNINALQQQNNQINQQNNMMNNWQNVFGTVTSGIGNILKGVGGLAGGLI